MPDLFKEALSHHAAGRIAEAERLYDAILAGDPDHAGALHHLGLVRAAQRRSVEAVALIERALAADPDSATAHYNLGTTLRALGRDAEAVASFRRAIALKPDYLAAHANLGVALQTLGRSAEATLSYGRVLALDPTHAETHNNFGTLHAGRGRLESAVRHYRQALAAKPDYVDARINLGKALRGLNRPAEAIAEFAEALRLRPGDVEAMRSQGMARLILGDFAAGWRQWRFARSRAVPRPLWLGDAPLEGKTILLWAEQGLGDTIQFARYVRLVAELGAKIVLEVQAELVMLLRGLPGVSAVLPLGATLPSFDCHCPLPSLPLAFGTELATIPTMVPYLAAPAGPASVPLPEGLRVGLTWGGNPQHLNDGNRSIPLERLAPLFDLDGIGFLALQKEQREGDAALLRRLPKVTDAARAMTDFDATASVVAELDLVITVDTSMAHLVGALGKEVWILLPFSPDFRWLLGRSDSPWYPTARLFRQGAPGDWDGVVAEVRAALARRGEAPSE
ncbi:MAG: glycosyltransferase family protein [Alphaproteobacteria bacterium]|nr:glycosyltransferase family protein [Alphaproteobacteria bacterium]